MIDRITVTVISNALYLAPGGPVWSRSYCSWVLVFSPALVRAKRDALLSYGALVNRYNRAFHGKWLDRQPPEHESLLGSSDVQSLADMGNSFRVVDDMGLRSGVGRRGSGAAKAHQ